MRDSSYWCVYQPNGHCVWETLHFDKKAAIENAPVEHYSTFNEKLTWRQMYRRGYRCERVTIRKVCP